MPTPEILNLSNRFHRQLLQRERAAATAMVRYYGASWERVSADARRLQAQVDLMRDEGQEISEGTIWRLQRMKAIQQQAEQELAKFARYADGAISGAQREAIAAGERNAQDLVRAGFPENFAVGIRFDRMPRGAVEAMVGTLQDGSPLAKLIQEAVGDAATQFSERLVTGLAAGWNPRKLAREIRSAFGMGLTRSLRIARTEQLRAYRTATQRSYQGSNVVTGWERMATLDTRTCMACVALDGKVYRLEEEMDDHVQGRCAMLPITKTYAELGIDAPEPDFTRELAPDWFERQDEATQRQMMGPGMFEAWKAGQFTLTDIPKLREDATWGNSWVPKTLGELAGEGETND